MTMIPGRSQVDVRHRGLGVIFQAEELAGREVKTVRHQVVGDLGDLGVEVAHHGVVVTAGVLDVIFEVGQGPLQF